MSVRDFQRSKCYGWEDLHVHRRSKGRTSYECAQAAVDYIWGAEGFAHPPRIAELPRQCKCTQASATRLKVLIPREGVETTVLLHELAHSMTSLHDGRSAHHGPRFVGVFMELLSRYAGHDLEELKITARSAGVAFNFDGPVIPRTTNPKE